MRKIQTAISSDLCIRLTWNLTGTSWVVSYGGKTIPRWRTNAILKIDISPYLSVKSSDFHDVIKKWKSCIGQTPSSTERISCTKTTTLLPSAKCTRPLFQGRTGCGGRPSGWPSSHASVPFRIVFDDWYAVGTVSVNMWRLVHQWSFLLFWLSFDLTLTT